MKEKGDASLLFIAINSSRRFGELFLSLSGLIFFFLKTNRPTTVALSSNSCLIIVRQLSDETEMGMGRLFLSEQRYKIL